MVDDSSQIESRRKQIASSLSKLLKKRGLDIAQCGRDQKHEDLKLDGSTGYWAAGYAGKPYRWIVHLEVANGAVQAKLAEGNTAEIGQFNMVRQNIGGLLVRVIPAVRTGTTFQFRHDWEWLLFFGFPAAMGSGTSSENFQFQPATGRLLWRKTEKGKAGKKTSKEKLCRYSAAALFGVVSPDATWRLKDKPVEEITYEKATAALRKLIQVDLPAPAKKQGGKQNA